MSLATRRVPRLVEADPAPSSSADVRNRLEALDRSRQLAASELARLEQGRASVLKNGTDEEAERHDAAMARARRAIERAELQRPDIRAELDQAQAREAAEALAKKQVAARSRVQAVIAKITTEYEEPAARIKAFLAEWADACREANAAGVPSPEQLLRYRPAVVEHAHDVVESYTTYLDEDGQETLNAYPPGSYLTGPNGEVLFDGTTFNPSLPRQHQRRGAPVPKRRQVARTRTVSKPYRVIRPAFAPEALHEAVCLPPARSTWMTTERRREPDRARVSCSAQP